VLRQEEERKQKNTQFKCLNESIQNQYLRDLRYPSVNNCR
jgi:hypothetical protein